MFRGISMTWAGGGAERLAAGHSSEGIYYQVSLLGPKPCSTAAKPWYLCVFEMALCEGGQL
jgi:hypothetical protein